MKNDITIPPGAYVLKHDVKNPAPDRRMTRDWRKVPVWRAGTEFIVREMRRDINLDEKTLAELPAHTIEHLKASAAYTVVEAVDDRWPSLHRVGPGYDEQYAVLAAALVKTDESHSQFMARVGCNEHFASWLVEHKVISRDEFEKLWHNYEYGEEIVGG